MLFNVWYVAIAFFSDRMLSRFVVRDFFPYLNYNCHHGDTLIVDAITPPGANDLVRVKLCTNDYGNYFPEFHNDRCITVGTLFCGHFETRKCCWKYLLEKSGRCVEPPNFRALPPINRSYTDARLSVGYMRTEITFSVRNNRIAKSVGLTEPINASIGLS